jgi:general secretion pathway protein G
MNDPMENPSLDRENSVNGIECSKYFNRGISNKGFTLIELMIVIAIIGTLSAIAVPNYLQYKNNAMIAVAVTDIRIIEKQIALFVTNNNGQLPNSLNDLTTIGNLNDPWGNPYRYLRISGVVPIGPVLGVARRNMMDAPVNQDYDLYSIGKDGQTNRSFKIPVCKDDVVRAYEGRYVGLVSEL